MGQFKYKAQTFQGEKVSGMMTAADDYELHRKLREQELFLVSCKEVSDNRRRKAFKTRILADFSRQLSTLVGSGVTLVRSRGIISNGESVKPKERAVYEDMLLKIRQGIALSDAMEAQNGAFPPLMIHMFRSAEKSGNLDQVAAKMADLYEKEHKLNGKLSGAMVYPKILVVMIIGVVLILTKFVMPQFEELFQQMDALPLSTRILQGFSNLIQKYWYLVIGVLALLMIGGKALLKVDSIRYHWDKIKLHVPVFGRLQKVICTARFAQTLSSLYSAGIPIVQALQISRKTIGNAYVDRQFDEVIPYVRGGNNLSDGLEMVDGFMRKLPDAIRVGEETGSLDSMLFSIADAMEYDADVAIGKMVSYVEPVMLIIMGGIVAFVMIAVFGAIYGSYDALSGMS